MQSKQYIQEAIAKTGQDLKIDNIMAYPKIEKVIVNVGVGKDRTNDKLLKIIQSDLVSLTGQKAKVNTAKKAVASFKVRKGETVGFSVTLRDRKMNDFVYKFIKIVLPAIRDFRGLPIGSFDQQNNYSVGIKEYGVFPEISFGQDSASHGIQITIVFKCANQQESKTLLEKLGFPFKKESENA